MLYYQQSAEEVLKMLESTQYGLSARSSTARLARHGPNVIKVHGEPLWRKLIEPFANVFTGVLAAAAIISLIENEPIDAIIVLAIILSSAIIYYIQRFSTERVLHSLQKHSAQAVEVLREGKPMHVDASLLVPGDIIVLAEGEKVPADARLLRAESVRVDESLLTGESVPVAKQTDELSGDKEIYEQNNLLFQGSFLASGTATAVVIRTGNDTEFGELATLSAGGSASKSPIQEKVDILVRQIVSVVVGVALVAFALSMFRGAEVGEALRFVLALSVSAVPESLPVAISVILVLGMRRMAARKALVRTMRAIETVGALTTIATDKTGTLTMNKLSVQTTWQPTGNDILANLLPRVINTAKRKNHDPVDGALRAYVDDQHYKVPRGEPLANLPFDQASAMSGTLWHHGDEFTLVVKGAPEHVIERCRLSKSQHGAAYDALNDLTAKGYRVLAIATTTLSHSLVTFEELPKRPAFTLAGFVAIADQLRPEAKAAIASAAQAGVTVRMITGDHFETAFQIARELGLADQRDQVLDSRRLADMNDRDLNKVLTTVTVFARVTPEAKYRILGLLKKHNITAMTGDGVNDVPALTNAHVGVAMGSGTSIARDAGDIILLDDNFKTIIDAIREGRAIIDNIRRMLYYLLSTNSGEVLTMVGSLIVGLPPALLPVQILWINLVTDASMVIPLGLEAGEEGSMQRPPRSSGAPILSKRMIIRMGLVASSMAVVALGVFAVFLPTHGHAYAQSLAFLALVVAQWANAFNARSEFESVFSRLKVRNIGFYAGLAIGVGLQSLVFFGPLGPMLHIVPLTIGDMWLVGLLAFVAPILVAELHKYFERLASDPMS